MKARHIFLISISSIIFVKVLRMFLPKDDRSILVSVSIGSIFLIFGVVFLVIYFQLRRKESSIAGGKEILFRGGANNYGVGGFLILTSEELIFKAHILNYHRYTLRIHLKEIVDIQPIDVMGLSKGLLITDNTTTHQFIINRRKLWINNIKKSIKI